MSVVPEAVRKQIRLRAGGRCEYCREPDSLSVYGAHVDHIIAKKHGGSSELENLACQQCNLIKGSDIASIDELTGSVTPLFNPRTHQWSDHFEVAEGVLAGKTAIGRATIRLLQLNEPHRILVRTQLIEAGEW